MPILGKLIVNNRAGALPRKRSILSLLGLMLIITFFVAFFFLNSDFLESKNIVDDGNTDTSNPLPAPSLVPPIHRMVQIIIPKTLHPLKSLQFQNTVWAEAYLLCLPALLLSHFLYDTKMAAIMRKLYPCVFY